MVNMKKDSADRLYRFVGAKIREARQPSESSPGYTQASLAKAVQLSRTSIVNIEKGRQHPPIHVLYSIANALSVDPLSLLPNPEILGAREEEPDSEILGRLYEQANGDPEIIGLVKQLMSSFDKPVGGAND